MRNANGKRPAIPVVLAASGGSPTSSKKPPPAHGKLQRDSRLGKYFDYDLSKMVNSKGGFLVEDDKEAGDDLKTKQRERERQRAVENLDPRTFHHIFNFPDAGCDLLTKTAVAISLDPSRNPKCHDCGSMDIDQMYRKVFRCLVCNKCKNDKVEKYSLLTKTECKEVSDRYSFYFYAV